MIEADYNKSIIYVLNYYSVIRLLNTDNSYYWFAWFADKSNWYCLSLPLLQYLLADLEHFFRHRNKI